MENVDTHSADKLLRVLVCGGRDYDDMDHVARTLDGLVAERALWSAQDEFGNRLPTGMLIIHGGASGADALADRYAAMNWLQVQEYKADWTDMDTQPVVQRRRSDGTPYNAAAGGIRNQRMLDDGRPDVVVAFPGGRGTADMVRRAKKAGVEVIEVAPWAR